MKRVVETALKTGVVTKVYPFVASPVPPGFRGRPRIDVNTCIGCGACSSVCPPNAIKVEELNGRRRISVFVGRCIFCARCEEICPVKAIKATDEYELASSDKSDLYQIVELRMVSCRICGRPFATERELRRISEELEKKGIKVEELDLCPECREKESARLESFARR